MSIQESEEIKLKNVLRDLLKKRDMTAAQLSRKAKVPKSVVSDWLSGASPRNLSQLMRVAKSLGVTLEMLCFGIVQRHEIGEGYRIRGLIEGDFTIIKRHDD